MAKERNLPQKATMTTSDYIRVVGSDNASYKQSMNSVMGAMGVYPMTVGYTNPQVSAFSELKDSGFYTIGSASNYSDAPVNTYGFLAVYKGGSYAIQRYYALGLPSRSEYVRFSTNNGTSWSAWMLEPTRAEMDDVKDHGTKIGTVGNTTGSVNMREVPGGQTVITTVPVGSKVFVIGGANNGSYKCLYLNTATGVWYQGYIVTQFVDIE